MQRAPVERHRRRARRGRPEGDPERGQAVVLQRRTHASASAVRPALVVRVEGRPLRRVALELGRRTTAKCPSRCSAVRRQHDRGLGPRRREAAAELLHPSPRRRLRLLEDRRPVRRDRSEDDHSKRADALDDQLGEAVAVDVEPDLRVRIAEVLAVAPVDVRAPPARAGRAVDLDERVAHVHQRRIDQVRDADGIVHRRARQIGVARLVEARVEVHQLGDHRADPAGGAHALGVLLLDQGAMRDVEPDHRRVEPFDEDALRRLRIGPDVELGGRRAVPLADRAAHQDDPLGARVGMQREQQADVRQRAGRDERQPCRRAADLVGAGSRRRAAARPRAKAAAGRGRRGPDSPCTCAATSRSRTNGLSAPA